MDAVMSSPGLLPACQFYHWWQMWPFSLWLSVS